MRSKCVLPVAGCIVGVATLVAFAAAPAAAATGASGAAYVVSADVSVLDSLKVNVPALPHAAYPEGANKSVVSVAVPADNPTLLRLRVLHATAGVDHGTVHSHADITDVALLGVIEASVLDADCTADADGVHGSSSVADLKVGPIGTPAAKELKLTAGHPVNLNAAGGLVGTLTAQTITITFDEHIAQGDQLTVNALHIHIGQGLLDTLHLGNLVRTDIILSQARCAKGAVPPPGTSGGNPTTTAPPTTTAGGGGGGHQPTSGPTTPAPAAGTGPSTTAPDNASGNGADTKNLAFTGVTGIVPMTLAGIALVGGGAGALFWVSRRRRSARR